MSIPLDRFRGTNISRYRDGLMAFTNPQGARVLVLRLGADPDDTPEWINEQRRSYDARKWRREMEGDWSTPSGDPYFPGFSEIGKDKFVHVATRLIGGPVFRSFDFGRRRPACTWFQYSAKSDRAWLLREFMPHEIQTHEFRDAVRFLSGEIEYDAIPDRAKRWADAYAAKPSGAHCAPPWFPLGTKFIDLAGKEALQGQANAVRPEEAITRDIFLAGGIPLIIVNPQVLGRNQIIDRMLMVRDDGWPGLFLDPQAEECIEGFDGGFSYPVRSKANPVPNKPKDDGHYINLLDAIGYGFSGVIPADKPKAAPEPVLLGYRGHDPVYSKAETDEVVPWYENRRVLR